MKRQYRVSYYKMNDKYTLYQETVSASTMLDAKDMVLARQTGFIVVSNVARVM